MVDRIRYIIENWWYNRKINKASCIRCGAVPIPDKNLCPECLMRG